MWIVLEQIETKVEPMVYGPFDSREDAQAWVPESGEDADPYISYLVVQVAGK